VTRSKADAKAAYNRLSRWYDLLSGSSEGRFLRLGLSKLEVKEGEQVLEIGFGTGEGILTLAGSVGSTGRVYGIDLSEGMLERAQGKLDRSGLQSRVVLECGDAMGLPYKPGSIDAVFMSFSLELFDTPEIPLVLEQCRRVLREGGRLCVVSMSMPPEPRLAVHIYEWAHKQFPAYVDCRPIFTQSAIEAAGFQVQDVTGGRLYGLPVEVILAEKPACH
jgi:demethylmenaquinone methyltransferase/2-methoxy-6-polyprenyl-1,4-benzoquinol methylase